MTTNPLLDFSDLPRFAAIKPEHVTPALDVLLAEARAAVAQVIAAGGDDWDSVSEPLSDATERLSRAWGVVGHLNSVMGNTEGLREVYNAEIPRISAFFTELGQNLDLYARFKAVAANPAFADASAARKKIIDNDLRDFRLSGAELPDAQKARFAELSSRLAELSSQFSQNVMDATDSFSLYIDDAAELAGIPEDTLALYAAMAEADGQPGKYKPVS